MKRRIATMALLFAGLVCAAEEQPAKDVALLAGDWNVVSVEKDGKALPKYKGAVRTHNGDNYTLKFTEGDPITGKMKLDPAKTPRQIDTTPDSGTFKGKTLPGIYKLEGDTFTVCFDSEGKDRPTEFTSKGTFMLVVHKKK